MDRRATGMGWSAGRRPAGTHPGTMGWVTVRFAIRSIVAWKAPKRCLRQTLSRTVSNITVQFNQRYVFKSTCLARHRRNCSYCQQATYFYPNSSHPNHLRHCLLFCGASIPFSFSRVNLCRSRPRALHFSTAAHCTGLPRAHAISHRSRYRTTLL